MDGYETPYERAHVAHDKANEQVLYLGSRRALSPEDATHMRFQSASFEMLTAIHEVLEQIERRLATIEAGLPNPLARESAG